MVTAVPPDDVSTDTSPTWEVLPPPSPVPVSGLTVYAPPARTSPDARSLKLVPLTIAIWTGLVLALLLLVLTSLPAPNPSIALGALFPMIALGTWTAYRIVNAPRLKLDTEVLTITTYGLRPGEISIPWAEIAALQLRTEPMDRGGHVVLRIRLRPDGTLANAGRRSELELPLGPISSRRVEEGLRRFCPRGCRTTVRRMKSSGPSRRGFWWPFPPR